MSDFLTIANELSDTKPKASGFAAIANDLNPAKETAKPNSPPAFEFDDAADFRKKLVAHGDPNLVAAFDKQYSTVAPKVQSFTPPPGMQGNALAVMPIPKPDNESAWDKVVGAGEAGLNAVTGATTGMLGGAASTVNNVVKHGLYMAAGDFDSARALPTFEQAYNEGVQAGTYQPKTAAGQRYQEDVVQPIAGELVKIAPVMGEFRGLQGAGTMARRAIEDPARAAMDRRSMGAAGEAFKGMQGRVEPSMGEAKLTPQQIEAKTAPTLAQATPELQAKVAASEAKGKPINQQVLQRHVEAETLPIPVKLTEGQALIDPVLISEEMNGRGKGKAATVSPEFYKQQGQAIAQNMEAIREKAAPDIPSTASMTDHGQTVLDSYKQMDEPVRADITAKYKALADANGGDLPLSGQSFVQAADAALKKANRTRFVPSEVQGIMADLREGGPMTFGDFETYRTILAEQARKADRAGDGTASYAVGLVRDALESLPMEGEAANLKPLADAARQAAKARFDAIKSDPAYKAAVSDSVGIGEPSPLADKFFNAYVLKGARANLAQMKARLANDPLANQAIQAGTLDMLSKQLKADKETGKFSQDGYNKGLEAIRPKLQMLLDEQTAQQAQALGNTAKLAQTQPRGSFVNNSNTATALLSEGAKTVATHGTNMLFGGLPVGSGIRAGVGRLADTVNARKAAQKATEPGAGINSPSDFPGIGPKREPK